MTNPRKMIEKHINFDTLYKYGLNDKSQKNGRTMVEKLGHNI